MPSETREKISVENNHIALKEEDTQLQSDVKRMMGNNGISAKQMIYSII
jgi:hypothetical protein